MVFSGTEAVSGGKGHGGDITGNDPMRIRYVTGAGIERDNTRGTRGNTDTGTGEEVEDVTLRGPDGVLVGCEDTALTWPGGELTRVKGLIPSGL